MAPTLLELERRDTLEKGYNRDFINVINRVKFVLDALEGKIMGDVNTRLQTLEPLPTYEQHFYGDVCIIQKSDPHIILQINTLIKEFNANLKRMKEEKDSKVIKKDLQQFWRNAKEILGLTDAQPTMRQREELGEKPDHS